MEDRHARLDVLKMRLTAAAVTAAASLLAVPSPAQDRVDDFRANCASCHSIGGGRLVGPDLKGVTDRQDRDWLVRFILDPQAVIQSGDPYARKLLDESRGVVMPAVPGMTRDRAAKLVDLIEAESALDTSQFGGLQISDRPFTAEDVALGQQLFLGTRRLAGGGPACVSCHSVSGLGVLAGGKLGPDLNEAFERLSGRKGLSTWLSAPATVTMQAVYKSQPLQEEEILALTAYFADRVVAPPENQQAATLVFILLGMSGAAAMLVIFDIAWRRRLRAVREPLVAGAQAAGRG